MPGKPDRVTDPDDSCTLVGTTLRGRASAHHVPSLATQNGHQDNDSIDTIELEADQDTAQKAPPVPICPRPPPIPSPGAHSDRR